MYLSPARADPRLLGKLAFSAAALASIAYVLWLGRGQTLILDEWSYLLDGRGWSPVTLLEPHNGHLIVFPVLVLKLMHGTFGISSHLPYQLLAVLLNVLIAGLLYVFARRSVGPLFALFPAILILFYGAGWDAFVTGYQLPNMFSMAAGLLAVLLVRRGDLRSDALTCLALCVSLASVSVGIAFAAGIAVALLLRGKATAIRRAWVVAVPAILYAAWFVWSTRFRESEATAHNAGSLFSGMFDQLAAIFSGITGLAAAPGAMDLVAAAGSRPNWGPTLVILALIGVILAFRQRRPSHSFLVALAVLLVYLATVALALGGNRIPDASRYVYMGSVMTLFVLIETVRGMRPATGWAIGLTIALFFSLLANGATMGVGGRVVRLESATNQAQLSGLEIARDEVAGDFVVEAGGETTLSNPDMLFDVGTYFDLTRSFGSPAYTEGELEGAPEQAREAADQLLARALPISVRRGFHPARSAPIAVVEGSDFDRRPGGCVLIAPGGGSATRVVVDLPGGGFTYSLAGAERPELKLRRFGEGFAVEPDLPPGPARVAIPTDRSERPWEAELVTASRLELCP
jgi:nicotinamide riboside transporter PnuC